MITSRSGAMGVSSFIASSSSYFSTKTRASSLSLIGSNSTMSRRRITCSAVQESSSSTSTVATDQKEIKKAKDKATAPAAATATPKVAAKAKAPVKPLPEMMEEDVIPSLRKVLETEDDITEIELSFKDQRLEGSFKKKSNPYFFWAFFPDGTVTGPKGFSISSYGTGASTVEPFLVDEKKITANHIVFWVEKRLAAQGIIPVWKE